MNYDSFFRFIFPNGKLTYFNIIKFNKLPTKVEVYFFKNNTLTTKFQHNNLESLGFMKKYVYTTISYHMW